MKRIYPILAVGLLAVGCSNHDTKPQTPSRDVAMAEAKKLEAYRIQHGLCGEYKAMENKAHQWSVQHFDTGCRKDFGSESMLLDPAQTRNQRR